MACYEPIPAWKPEGGGQPKLWPPLGKENLALPCQKCIGCRAAHATQWARRSAHEANTWDHNIFLTLTYDDDNLPRDNHLRESDLRGFFKRLRSHRHRTPDKYLTDRNAGIRYLACGEYGEENGRPHYHAIIFNLDLSDKYRVSDDLHESETIAKLWTAGLARFGDATPAAANYIAQYSLKKQGAGDHIPGTGEWRPAPFLRMSTRPAIGFGWLTKYQDDLKNGYLVDDGRKGTIPRSYLKKLRTTNPTLEEEITYRKGLHTSPDNTPERRKAAEIIHRRKKQLTENRHL